MKNLVIKYIPYLGRVKRFLKALVDSKLQIKSTYSQYKEDIIVFNIIKQNNLFSFPYIDIGANHPTDISNTYLMYRNGMRGYVIEPNRELLNLHRSFRKFDKQILIGCGNENTILELKISKTPVLSSFNDTTILNFQKAEFVPVLKLDDALLNQKLDIISFISIDVEGMNLDVLKGAKCTISKTRILCIEFESENEKQDIINELSDFNLVLTVNCNLIFQHK